MAKARLAFSYTALVVWPKRPSVTLEIVKRYETKMPGHEAHLYSLANQIAANLTMPHNASLGEIADQLYMLAQQLGGNVHYVRVMEGPMSVVEELVIEEVEAQAGEFIP